MSCLIYIVKYVGGGGGSGVFWADMTYQYMPKRPTLKSGRNGPAEITHGRIDTNPPEYSL